MPGSEGPLAGVDEAQALADDDRLSRDRQGGGGRRRARHAHRPRARQAGPRLATCQAEAGAAFGSSELYLEKFVEEARHVEVQVLGDQNGMRLHLGERDCSVQRRHQKLLEESPGRAIAAETRAGLCKAALAVANAVNYVSAGTVEFLVDQRRQLLLHRDEHADPGGAPGHRDVTGIDIVREQIRIAAGEPLGYEQNAVQLHAATPSSAGSMPRIRSTSCPPRAASTAWHRSRAVPGSAWTAT